MVDGGRLAISVLDQISKWLADHALAIQAFSAVAGLVLTAALVATTIVYAYITRKILEESHKSREATEQQANVANETLQFVKQRYGEDLIRHLQELRAAISDGLDLARTWMHHQPGIVPDPQAIPDPSELTENRLLEVRAYARQISVECENLVFNAHTALRNAKAEFEKLRQAVHGPKLVNLQAGNPQPSLQAAYDLLLKARRIVDEYQSKQRAVS